MKFRVLVGALVLGLCLLGIAGASAQTNDSTSVPEVTNPSTAPATGDVEASSPADTAEEQSEEVAPVEVVQPQAKTVTSAAKTKPKITASRPASRPPVPPPQPVEEPDFAAKIAPIGAETAGSVMSAGTLVPMSPVPGAAIPLNKVPGGVSILQGTDFAREGYVDTFQEILRQRVPGVIISDLQGNEFQTNIQYRGFEASPVPGVPQGLAVYQNGVRVNEAFADNVNWDFLPEIAINNLAVVSGNPVYGLNALGGAIVVNMKSGFTYQGAELIFSAGSFGRAEGDVQAGLRSGNWGVYFGGERITDNGYRDFSEAEVRRMFFDLGYQNSIVDLHFNLSGADNFVGVTASAPLQLLALNRERTFTSPQTTKNEMLMPAFNGTAKINETTTLGGVAYYRDFRQSHDDGNISEAEECENDPTLEGLLCIEGEEVLDQTGNPIEFDSLRQPIGSIDRTGQKANSWGGAVQLVNTDRLFGHQNQFLVGASYDKGEVTYGASSELGFFRPRFVVDGAGIILSAPTEVQAKSLGTENEYIGVYFSDTFNVTDRLAVTAGGRWNQATIQIQDLSGTAPELDGTNEYQRFNPAAGATYQLNNGLSLYGGYTEANRAPVAAEIACSDPNNPCLIESFLVADPPLDQVVSHTWEAGIRGERQRGNELLQWSAGLFRTLNTDDIITVFSPIAGRGVFENGGDTLRQGIEASVAYSNDRWFTYANYAFIDATYETALELAAPDNPRATECETRGGDDDDEDEVGEDDDDEVRCIFVRPGDRIPGIPQHRFKAGFDYWITSKWKFGADTLAVSSQYFFQDDSNINQPLGGYWTVDLHTSYDITPRIQIFGLINNVFDREYGVFGTFFNLEAGNSAASADPALGDDFFTNPRTITPGPPVVAYGGVKVKFW
ncbi:MAG: TonB-dependent receptor [Alphaproteobacteria bacterium]|nr:TonB-dependent receptor [Alphaproteobacteria bacterium]